MDNLPLVKNPSIITSGNRNINLLNPNPSISKATALLSGQLDISTDN